MKFWAWDSDWSLPYCRLWNTTREITYLVRSLLACKMVLVCLSYTDCPHAVPQRREMKVLAAYRRAGQSSAGFPYIDSPPAEGSNPLSGYVNFHLHVQCAVACPDSSMIG